MGGKVNKYVNVDVFYIRETQKAYLLRMGVNGAEVWFPKKLVFDLDMGLNRGLQRVRIAEFMLIQKGYGGYVGNKPEPTIYRKWECVDCGAKGSQKGDISKCPSCGSYRLWQEAGVNRRNLYCQKCGAKYAIKESEFKEGLRCDYCGEVLLY